MATAAALACLTGPAAAATSPARARITATSALGTLTGGRSVHVSGENFSPRAAIVVAQCSPAAVKAALKAVSSALDDCDEHFVGVAASGADGSFTVTARAEPTIETASGEIDCRQVACLLGAVNLSSLQGAPLQVAILPLSFSSSASSPPAPTAGQEAPVGVLRLAAADPRAAVAGGRSRLSRGVAGRGADRPGELGGGAAAAPARAERRGPAVADDERPADQLERSGRHVRRRPGPRRSRQLAADRAVRRRQAVHLRGLHRPAAHRPPRRAGAHPPRPLSRRRAHSAGRDRQPAPARCHAEDDRGP